MNNSDKAKISCNLSQLTQSVTNIEGLIQEAVKVSLIPTKLYEEKIRLQGSKNAKTEVFFLEVMRRGPRAYSSLLNCLKISNNIEAFNILSDDKIELHVKPNHLNDQVCLSHKSYPLNSSPKGNVLIINNHNYKFTEKNRWGSEKDVERLYNLFTKLDFRVIIKSDLNVEELDETLTDFAQRDDHGDSCFVFIGSHGSLTQQREAVLCYDEGMIPVPLIWRKFDNYHCPKLCGKPKIFLFQICRGDITDTLLKRNEVRASVDGVPEFPNTVFKAQGACTASISDTLCLFATAFGYTALRDDQEGSWMIQIFCDVIEKFGEKSLNEIINLTSQAMKTRKGEGDEVQTLTVEKMGFDRPFYFTSQNHS